MIACVRRYLVTKFVGNIQTNTQFATLHVDIKMRSLVIKWREEIVIYNIANIAETKVKVQNFAKKRAWAKVSSQSRRVLV